jgi:Na+/H+ antiporter NhaD/arsenite permease-like protein
VTVAVTVEAVWKAGVDAVVVALLQALNTEVATNSNAVKPMSHFLLNLFDNLRSPFSYFLYYKRPSLRRV